MTSGYGSSDKVQNYLIRWHEENGGAIGEGLSRTSNPNSKLFSITVEFGGKDIMRERIRATTKQEALKFAKNRYPSAIKITHNPKANDKRPT